jgi:Ca2+-binding RTX toxin-like protein
VGTNSDNNVITGGAGTDLLFGLGGDDTLIGGSANIGEYNQLWADTGFDTASYVSTSNTVYADLNVYAGWVDDGTGILVLTDVYNSVENLTGGSAADSLVGDSGANIITGLAGADLLYGNTGVAFDASVDTFVFTSVADSNLLTGYDTLTNFKTGQDKIDFTAFAISSAEVTILTGGGSTSVYANTDGIVGDDIAFVIIGNSAAVVGDILF